MKNAVSVFCYFPFSNFTKRFISNCLRFYGS